MGLYGLVVLLALAWTLLAHRSRWLVFGWGQPGLLQVGLEVLAISFVGIALPYTIGEFLWEDFYNTVPSLSHQENILRGFLVVLTVAAALVGPVWPGLRVKATPELSAGPGGTVSYRAAQVLIASLFYLLPWFGAALLVDALKPALPPSGDQGFSEVLVPVIAADFGWPVYLGLALLAGWLRDSLTSPRRSLP